MENTIPTHITAALRAVLDYLMDDERTHYEAITPNERKGHMFESLTIADHWLTAIERRTR